MCLKMTKQIWLKFGKNPLTLTGVNCTKTEGGYNIKSRGVKFLKKVSVRIFHQTLVSQQKWVKSVNLDVPTTACFYPAKTLNCIRYPALLLVHKGVPWYPLKKTTFLPDFFNYFYTMYTYINHHHISAKIM